MKYKVQNAGELDPQVRGHYPVVNNPHILYDLPYSKYVNVAAETLYTEATTVKRGLICRQVFDEVEYE